jgi:hypothetical protein
MYNVPPVTGSPTVAIVTAGHYPYTRASMDYYRTQMQLPPCTTCFLELNQYNQKGPLPTWTGDGWGGETDLDVQMVSAICPTCNIVLVEAESDSTSDLEAAVSVAARNAHWVSMSWGSPEMPTDVNRNSTYVDASSKWHDLYVAGTGDWGYGAGNLLYPSTSPNVVGAGGTAPLPDAASARGFSETAWINAGSGCSAYQAKPAWQSALPGAGTGCTTKGSADVSAVAGSNTAQTVGVQVWSNAIGWSIYRGTSVATPIIATMYAIAGNQTAPNAPYTNAAAHPEWVNDITSGSTTNCPAGDVRLCTATTGWDGPTGLGTPANVNLFLAPGATPIAYPSVNVTAPAAQQTVAGTRVNLQATASTSAYPSTESYSWSATGLPDGVSISSSTGGISGAPTAVGAYTVVLTATGNSSSAVGTASFTWAVTAPPKVVTINSAGQAAQVGVDVDVQLSASTSNLPGGESYTWTATDLPSGLSISSTGRITGTPTTAGSFTSIVTANGNISGASATKSLTWTIAARAASVVKIAASGQRGRVGVGVDVQLSASTSNLPGGESYTWTATGLPAGLSISSTGRITGTPTTAGTFASKVTASGNISGASATTTIGWSIAVSRPVTRTLVVAKGGKVKGKPRAGRVVKAVLPTVRTSTGVAATGLKATVRWYVNGHLVKGKSKKLRLKAKWRYKRIAFTVTYMGAGYTSLTYTSAKVRVV